MAALALSVFAAALLPAGASAVAPSITHTTVSAVSASSATLEAEVNPQGLATTVRFEYGTAKCSVSACKKTAPESIGSGSSPALVKVPVTGLTPGTLYFMRAFASNGTIANGPDHAFATATATPQQGLPEGRAYEQASPVDKDGGDAMGKQVIVKAADDGNAISFASTFGIPGGLGAQSLPTFLASRGTDWSTRGLLPAASFGQRAQVLGWTPDYSTTFSNVTQLGNPRTKALLMQSTNGSFAPRLIAPYTAEAEYAYAGTSADGSTVYFESQAKLDVTEGEAIEGASNIYAWDAKSEALSLVSVLNKAAETDSELPRGAFAGPYNWAAGINGDALSLGGARRGYYLQEERAITAAGLYFTAAGTGQLYLRRNPTMPQSEVVAGKCTKPQDACTIQVSATKKTNGKGKGGVDPAGPQPAAFAAASEDGSKVFFTSPEMLSDNANTGTEQPEAQIGIGSSTGTIEKPDFIPTKAVGLAVDGEHVYWADPAAGEIGRAKLDGSEVEKAFLVPPSGECEVEVKVGSGEFEMQKEEIPSTPRYLAVEGEHIYWTNTGIAENDSEVFHSGSIGRAKLNGTGDATEVDPNFVCGASNPQGIVVNAEYLYWANASEDPTKRWISRAKKADGSEATYKFIQAFGSFTPYGVALSADHLYYAYNDEGNDHGFIAKVPLAGGEQDGIVLVGKAGVRGITVDASHVRWASQSEEAIGQADLELENVNTAFVSLAGKPVGLAEDGAHLYWSVNGEAPTNPGNDLYRYEPATGTLTDLTPVAPGENLDGAEVQGVVGASADGSRVYFLANADLDGAGPAEAGDCHTNPPHGRISTTEGHCSFYELIEGAGAPVLIARLSGGDVLDWVPTPRELFKSYASKTSFLTADGRTLLFRSTEQLSAYENEGTPELYRYREGDPAGIRCASCRPGGERAGEGPGFEAVHFPSLEPRPDINAVASRILSADGEHAFFETAEALSPTDTNGQGGCPIFNKTPSCLDVYEWTASGAGECTQTSPAYTPLDQGCVYLISSGTSDFPSFFADASASGKDVFFFTRSRLVGQDKDELQDVYDARVGGGIASQNPAPANPCESTEACHGPDQGPASEAAPVTPGFHGPANKKSHHKKHTKKKHKKQKKSQHGKQKRGRAAAKGRASR